VTLAGRVEAVVDGRPILIDASGDVVTLEPAGWRQAWSLRRDWPRVRGLLSRVGERLPVRVVSRLPMLGEVALYPSPAWWARLLLRG